MVTQDLRGDGSEIPFVDEGSDEDYRDAVRSQDGRKTYFWNFHVPFQHTMLLIL